MRIECVHGYFKFTETELGQMSEFVRRFGLDLERSGDHFTFTKLATAPEYALKGGTYLGALCTVTYAGKPWQIMRANSLVFDFTTGLMVPITSITRTVQLTQGVNFIGANGMIIPGSIKDDGLRVKDYSAFFSESRGIFRYSEVDSD